MIDPNIWQSQDFASLSTLSQLTFIGLFSNADDYGYGQAKAVYIKSILFPYSEDLRVSDIDKTLSEIASKMSVVFYSHDGKEYYSLVNWNKWQKVDKPQPSKIPPFDDASTIIRRTIDEHSTNIRRTIPPNRIEENRIEDSIEQQEQNAREDVAAVYTHYETLFGTINPTVAEEIGQYIDNGMGTDLLCMIFDITQSEGKRFKYAKSIIESCIKDNILTVEAFKTANENFKKKKDQPPVNKHVNYTQSGNYDMEDIERRIIDKMLKEN